MNEDKATRYHRLKRRSSAAGVVAGLAALLAFWLSGGSAWLRTLAERTVQAAGVPSPVADVAVVAAYVAALCVAAESDRPSVGRLPGLRARAPVRAVASAVLTLVSPTT